MEREKCSCHCCEFRYDITLNIHGATYRIEGIEWAHSTSICQQITPG